MKIWVAESLDGHHSDTAAPSRKKLLDKIQAGSWLIFRLELGKIDVERVCNLYEGLHYEETRDHVQDIRVETDGSITRLRNYVEPSEDVE